MTAEELKGAIRTVPDFPKQGIMFRDITTLLKSPIHFEAAVDLLTAPYLGKGITKVVGVESRGFICGGPIALRLGAGFVPARKPKKLPAPAISEKYSLEYGTDTVEMHVDAIVPGDRVLLHDDLLATGGTMSAVRALVERLGGSVVGISFLVELAFLNGRNRLPGSAITSIVRYESE